METNTIKLINRLLLQYLDEKSPLKLRKNLHLIGKDIFIDFVVFRAYDSGWLQMAEISLPHRRSGVWGQQGSGGCSEAIFIPANIEKRSEPASDDP